MLLDVGFCLVWIPDNPHMHILYIHPVVVKIPRKCLESADTPRGFSRKRPTPGGWPRLPAGGQSRTPGKAARKIPIKTIGPPGLRGALQWAFAIGEKSRLRKELDRLGRIFLPGQEAVLGWLGDWVMFGVLDHSGQWDLARPAGKMPDSKGDARGLRAVLHLSRLPGLR